MNWGTQYAAWLVGGGTPTRANQLFLPLCTTLKEMCSPVLGELTSPSVDKMGNPFCLLWDETRMSLYVWEDLGVKF